MQLKKPECKPDWLEQEEYDLAPQLIAIRELKVKGKVLITTLLSPKATSKK